MTGRSVLHQNSPLWLCFRTPSQLRMGDLFGTTSHATSLAYDVNADSIKAGFRCLSETPYQSKPSELPLRAFGIAVGGNPFYHHLKSSRHKKRQFPLSD